jgi:hypothetical protein
MSEELEVKNEDGAKCGKSDQGRVVMRHKHDCSKCTPLGIFEDYDLYYCDSTETTLIARFGEDGDYKSGLCSGETGIDPVLAIAYHMARAKKLIDA